MLNIQFSNGQHYTNYYAVHIDGGPEMARNLSLKYGFVYINQVSIFLAFDHDISINSTMMYYKVFS